MAGNMPLDNADEAEITVDQSSVAESIYRMNVALAGILNKGAPQG